MTTKIEGTCTGCGSRIAMEASGGTGLFAMLSNRDDLMFELLRKFLVIHERCPGGAAVKAS